VVSSLSVYLYVCVSHVFVLFFLFFRVSIFRATLETSVTRAGGIASCDFIFLSLSLSLFSDTISRFSIVCISEKKRKSPPLSEMIAGTAVPNVFLRASYAIPSFHSFVSHFFLSMRRVCCKKCWTPQRAIQLFTARDHVDSISA